MSEANDAGALVVRSRGLRRSRPTKGVALVVVLSLVVIVSLILVAFVTTMWMDRTASASYGQSLAAEQIGQGALNLVVAELRNEMAKDALPDLTYPDRPLHTNVTSANILPQKVGTNSAMPSLIKISAATNFFEGTRTVGTLKASGVSTFAPSKNGRFLDVNRWGAPYLGTFPNTSSLPNWVIMTRGGATNTGDFGPTGATLNNPAPDNMSYAIGRFAYAVYDVGGLMDITVAGHPSTLTPAQINQLKGTLAGADLSVLGIADVDALVQWRNAASKSDYMGYVTNVASANGFSQIAPGDNTFLGRQDLIKAAKLGVAGLSTGAVTNFTTFSREKNAPSWGPQSKIGVPSGNAVDYAGLSTNLTSGTNLLTPYVRYGTAGTITTYKIDGTATNYPVVAGDSVVSRRFPLDRIKWIGPSGPQNGGALASIQACFGLAWDAPSGVWKYVGPTGSVEQTDIKSLVQVAAEKREPNFFELLKAGILSGSLAMEANTGGAAVNYSTVPQTSLPLHVFRIGASILSQYESSACPIVVEFMRAGQPWQAYGTENLPYLNMFQCLTGANSASNIGIYLMIGLWNPHQGVPSNRPDIRIRMIGEVVMQNDYGRKAPSNSLIMIAGNTPNPHWGYRKSLNTTIDLSASALSGANGFIDPHALFPSDLQSTPGPGTSAGMEWASLPPINGTTYAGYRLPDFIIDPTDQYDDVAAAASDGGGWWSSIWFCPNSNRLLQPFNVWLEFKNPNGVWVPYNYHAGLNDTATWITKQPKLACDYMGPNFDGTTPQVAKMQPIDPPAGLTGAAAIGYYRQNLWETPDPRSLRFGYTQHATAISTPAWSAYLQSSMWSAADSSFLPYGRSMNQNVQRTFGTTTWFPAGLSRNNTPPAAGSPPVGTGRGAAYADPDGVQRLADSGLFETSASVPTTSPTTGNPYAKSTARVADRPIILNRPFSSVAELGYVNRDYPWRTLDFFSLKSADGGLLDLFTMGQSEEPYLKGKVSLNTQNRAVVEAMLTSTFADVLGSAPVTFPERIATTVAGLTSQSSGLPLVNKSEIPNQIVSQLAPTDFGGTDEQFIKARREGVTRALADVTQTRTWNLLIDIVAQSGRFGPAATAADQFVVEGERRFWLHVAIDRITGEIVDQQLEPVTQ